ncbi:MAG: biotin--[acetyl-CoA-carboxylase] ligase [Gemmatimonadota bacterium]|nr:MAG: biotin--[acetyl-CoA-carboxylase] ligase [Gemmatimonadota bacterium]
MKYDGLGSEELAHRLGVPRCLVEAQVTSALDMVHRLAAEGAPAGTVVLADEQTAGRGRLARKWISPRNKGIWLGYLVRPGTGVTGGLLAIRVGLAVLDTLADLDVTGYIKWPNDVLVRNRKLAGILCEGRAGGDPDAWVAVGIGMNVYGPVAPEIRREAIALDEVAARITRISVLEKLVPGLNRLSQEPVLDAVERERFQRRDWLSGRLLSSPLAGAACGIDGDGALLVRTPSGIERVVGGSVVTA